MSAEIRSGPPACLRARARRRRSRCCWSAATPRARSTSRAASGWTTIRRARSASSRGRPASCSRVHAPIAGFMGHAERGKKLNMAVGMLDHSAGIAKAAGGASVVVFHPGFLLGRTREEAIDSVCEQLGELRERLEGKERAVPFGIEVMGRVRELGSARRRRRDLAPPRLGAAGARLRAHARDLRRRVHRRPSRSPRRSRRCRRGARAGRAVPHPLLGHRVREPQRDEAPALRRGDAAGRAAAPRRSRGSSGRRR